MNVWQGRCEAVLTEGGGVETVNLPDRSTLLNS